MGGVRLVRRVVTLVGGVRLIRRVVTLVGGVRIVRRVVSLVGGVRLAMSAHSDFVWSRVYTCLAAVSCHLHFWPNDRDLLRATAVTRRWNEYRNKSQRRKLTLEKIALPLFLLGIEPATFRSRDHRDDFFRRAALWSLGLV